MDNPDPITVLLQHYLDSVLVDWEKYWQDKPDHRYGQDFYAFLGERFVTNFYLRDVKPIYKTGMVARY